MGKFILNGFLIYATWNLALAIRKPKVVDLSEAEMVGKKVILEIQDRDDEENPGFAPYTVDLYPETQHIPMNPAMKELRPPPPRIPDEFDIFVGMSSFRDGERCGYAIFTAFKRAAHPNNIYFGIVDQVASGDMKCLDAYCKMAKKEWPDEDCRFLEQIRIDQRRSRDSRGPTLARHYQQQLITNEEFCLQLDAHSVFTMYWDRFLVKDWANTNNEMAILSSYIHDPEGSIKKNGRNNVPKELPHLCQTMRTLDDGMVRNIGADIMINPTTPQLSALWGAGFSFGKCHAEKRSIIDPHTRWLFDGEEFLRAASLWTHGYDIYSPSRTGAVIYHNYSSVPKRFEDIKVDEAQKAQETQEGLNRFRQRVGMPVTGPVNEVEFDKYGWGNARTFDEYLEFSGVTFQPDEHDRQSCYQLHWVPYSNATVVEHVVSDWQLIPTTPPPTTREVKMPNFARGEKKSTTQSVTPELLSTKVNELPTTVPSQRSTLPRKNFMRESPKQEIPFNYNGALVIIAVACGIIVYSNDGLWHRVRRAFRSKYRMS